MKAPKRFWVAVLAIANPFLVTLLLMEVTFVVLDCHMFGDHQLALHFLTNSAFTPAGFATTILTVITCVSGGGLLAKQINATPSYMAFAGAVFGTGLSMSLTALWAAGIASFGL
jgi:hypothetical protein